MNSLRNIGDKRDAIGLIDYADIDGSAVLNGIVERKNKPEHSGNSDKHNIGESTAES